MSDSPYPNISAETARHRRELAGETFKAFHAFSQQAFAEGALSVKTKQLIALAVAHVTQCPYCIESHAKLAVRNGASDEEIMEAVWVAAEMRAGGAYAHAGLCLEVVKAARSQSSS